LLPPDDDKATDEDLDDDEDALSKDQITLEEVSPPRVVIHSENRRAVDIEDKVKELVLDIPYVVGAGGVTTWAKYAQSIKTRPR
jgi:hypothetical protein